MEDRFVELITDHFGAAFFICVLLFGAVVFLIWWAFSVYYKVKSIEKLPCQQNSDKIDTHIGNHTHIETSIVKLETSISYMQKSIDSLAQSLQSNHKVIADPFTQTHSPLSITEKGYEMIKRIGMDEMFESNWERIKKLIEECSASMNPYDIQQFCMQQAVVFPEKFLNEKQLDTLKTDAYNTGIPLTSYMKVLAVLSRDRFFKENGIDISEVDKR